MTQLRRILACTLVLGLVTATAAIATTPPRGPQPGLAHWQESAFRDARQPPCGTAGCGTLFTFGPGQLNGLISIGERRYEWTANLGWAAGYADYYGIAVAPIPLRAELRSIGIGGLRTATGSCSLDGSFDVPWPAFFPQQTLTCDVRVQGAPAGRVRLALSGGCYVEESLDRTYCSRSLEAGRRWATYRQE